VVGGGAAVRARVLVCMRRWPCTESAGGWLQQLLAHLSCSNSAPRRLSACHSCTTPNTQTHTWQVGRACPQVWASSYCHASSLTGLAAADGTRGCASRATHGHEHQQAGLWAAVTHLSSCPSAPLSLGTASTFIGAAQGGRRLLINASASCRQGRSPGQADNTASARGAP
jgi:hypothetical protein